MEDLDGSGPGQRFWKGEKSRPNALVWPIDKKRYCAMTSFSLAMLTHARILAGVERMFNELQDYSVSDRKRGKSRPTPKIYQETVCQRRTSNVSRSDT